MAKKLRQGERILIAPDIKGWIDEDGNPKLQDIRSNSFGEDLNPFSIETKILIYERQVKEWFLIPALNLSYQKDRGFLALMAGCSYIEGYIQNFEGVSSDRNSSTYFKKGFRAIFDPGNEIDETCIKEFHIHVRCGLFHDGMTRGKVILYFDEENECRPIDFSDPDIIKIYPRIMLKVILNHFEGYLATLKNPEESKIRDNFNKTFMTDLKYLSRE